MEIIKRGNTVMANDAFAKLKSSVNRGITTISVKTSATLEKTKIKTHIETLEMEIEKLYRNIGETMYMQWVQGEFDGEISKDSFELVKQKKQMIVDLTAELVAVDERNNQILGNTADAQMDPIKAEPRYICSNCGTQYEVSTNFCRKCGNKMTE